MPVSDYLVGLVRVLDAPPIILESAETVAFPGQRALALAIAPDRIDWLEFARLHRCDLGALIGYRNSRLGRVMQPVRRLDYELQWLAQGTRCRSELQSESSSAATIALLDQALEHKQRQLQPIFWNAVMAGDEVQRWMGRSALQNPGVGAEPLHELIAQLQRLPQGDVSAAHTDRALQQLAQARRVGLAQKQWQEARWLLHSAAALLRQYGGTVCRNGQPTPKAQRLKAVFTRYYVGIEQPRLARWVNADASWVRALAELTQHSGTERPLAYRAWYQRVLDPDRPDSHWQQTRGAFQDHARAWQALAEACGMNLFQ